MSQPKSMGARVVQGAKAVKKSVDAKGRRMKAAASGSFVPNTGMKKAAKGLASQFHKTKAFKVLDKIAPGPSVTAKIKAKVEKAASRPIPKGKKK
jgi:hypothetical protein